MMRSLYTGITGLKNHQTRMDVIGNNIANVNTVGYKTSRVVFQDIFSQGLKGGSANANVENGLGGTNPMQVGLGVKLSSIDVIHRPAPIAYTDNMFDMMISGDGFFIVAKPLYNATRVVEDQTILVGNEEELDADGEPIPIFHSTVEFYGPTGVGQGFEFHYTRAGNFGLDDEGFLVTSDGYYVLGYQIHLDPATGYFEEIDTGEEDDDGDPIMELKWIPASYYVANPAYDSTVTGSQPFLTGDVESYPTTYLQPIQVGSKELQFAVDDKGEVTVLINNRRVPIAQLGIAMFSNPGGLEKEGGSLYRETRASGQMQNNVAGMLGRGPVLAGGLEMSNVDLANEFTDMIVTQRGFQANSRIITVSDTMLEELVNLKR